MATKKAAKKPAPKAAKAAKAAKTTKTTKAAKPAKAAKAKPKTKARSSVSKAAATALTNAAASQAAKAPKAASAAADATSGEAQRFLASILADPDDRKARLVYADLLQDAGDPRGEFIITQSARADCTDGDERIPELDARIAEIEKKHKKLWQAACGENKGARYEYRRGFVEKLSINAKDLLANASKIFAAEPLEELNVWKIDESPTKVGKSRLAPILALPLGRIKRLSLARCQLTPDDYAALAAASPDLTSLELLDLTNGGSYEQKIGGLAKAAFPKLRELKITGCMCGDAELAKLATSKTLRFSRLIAQRNDVDTAGCEAIANAAWAPLLEHLDLSSNEGIGEAGFRALAGATKLTALRSLVLNYVGLYQNTAEIALGSKLFEQLELLDLTNGLSLEDHALIGAKLGDRLLPKYHPRAGAVDDATS